MQKTPLEQNIETLSQPVADDLNLRIVQVKVIGDSSNMILQIMAENKDTGRISIDECASLSRALSVALDVEDPIKGKYRLEVSSPGIDRPLTSIEDFKRFKGLEAKLETQMPTETGQKRFRGIIEDVEENVIRLRINLDKKAHDESDVIALPFDGLNKAKLVLNDELIKRTAER